MYYQIRHTEDPIERLPPLIPVTLQVSLSRRLNNFRQKAEDALSSTLTLVGMLLSGSSIQPTCLYNNHATKCA